ncbi:MAG: 6-carboxytetrahydropterin synthase, partial [Thermoguttaceae bacterium]|nr:6-carboxytetrahydropterin synthase [Thermoguttaceae bacterium]
SFVSLVESVFRETSVSAQNSSEELTMFSISRDFSFSYGHRLLNYSGKCQHPHGHNAKVRITIASEKLDEHHMVVDFVRLKSVIGGWIDNHLDHRMILAKEDPLVEVLKKMGEPVFLVNENPTAETLAKLVFDIVQKQGFPVQKVDFWETRKCFACYSAE